MLNDALELPVDADRLTNSKLGRFLRDLIEVGNTAPADAFKRMALERLQGLVPFDMALWASGHAESLDVHNYFVFNLPPDMLATWERHRHDDRLLAKIVECPGRTFDIHELLAREERHRLEIYRQHSRLYGIENAISTAIPDEPSGLLEILSLYRGDAKQPFEMAERALKQFVFPLLIDAWRYNQIDHLRRASVGSIVGRATAIADPKGLLRQIEKCFVRLLEEEWPGWRGPRFPDPVVAWLKAGPDEPFAGQRIVVSATVLADLVLLESRLRGPIELLTRRERVVAQSFAAGLTYKEIARELTISPSTVRRHLDAIYAKLNVTNKVELHYALEP